MTLEQLNEAFYAMYREAEGQEERDFIQRKWDETRASFVPEAGDSPRCQVCEVRRQ